MNNFCLQPFMVRGIGLCLVLVLGVLPATLFHGERASAVSISITNASFEDPVLADVQNSLFLTGWTISAITGGGSVAGAFNPGTAQFTGEAPDGSNTAFSDGGDLAQTLTAVLTANTTYTLEVEVGDRKEKSFPGYKVQLRAGGVLLAEDNNTLSLPNDSFVTSTVGFTALAGNPNLGAALEIRLINPGGLQVNWDNVRLTAVIPEASSMVLGAVAGLFSMAAGRWQSRKRKLTCPHGRSTRV